MTVFTAALSTLGLSQVEAANLIGIGRPTVADIATGRRGARLKTEGWQRLGSLFELVEQAADEIIADQAELDGGEGLVPLVLYVSAISLDTRELREIAAARALLVLGPHLLVIVEESPR